MLSILQDPDPRLRQISNPVETVDKDVLIFMDKMLEAMYAHEGIGLAAPQVNVFKRIIVIDIDKTVLRCVNPRITWQSQSQASFEEGCLSVDGYKGRVFRPDQVKVNYLDDKNKEQEHLFEGIWATCIQHEIDHLNGILFVDHLSALKQSLWKRKRGKRQ